MPITAVKGVRYQLDFRLEPGEEWGSIYLSDAEGQAADPASAPCRSANFCPENRKIRSLSMKYYIPITLSVLILSGCMTAAAVAYQIAGTSSGSSPAQAVYRENPAPQEGYRIRMVIRNAPGGFAYKQALAQYDVVNRECLRPPKYNAGGYSSAAPTYDMNIPLTQVSANEYEAVVYKDAMQNADFYGYGTCRWELIQFRVVMAATGRQEETRFIPSIPEYREPKISTRQTETLYFNKRSYPGSQGFPVFGAPRHRYNEQVRDEDLFAVSFIPMRLR